MRGLQFSIGRIVFFTLFCMTFGAFAIGFVSISGIKSFRTEFSRLVDQDLPQATIATRLNAEISGLSGQVGLLAIAKSQSAIDTIRIQIGDQLNAISRQKDQFRDFPSRPDEYVEIDNALNKLTSNLEFLARLSSEQLATLDDFSTLRGQIKTLPVSTEARLVVSAWVMELGNVERVQELEALAPVDGALTGDANTPEMIALAQEFLTLKRRLLEGEANIEGRLNFHRRLAAQLTDTTRFMSSRLISEANGRSNSIFDLFRTNSYLVLISLMGFAAVATFIFVYLDKHVVARIQKLTQRINEYEGHDHKSPEVAGNEILTIEASFATLTETIAEREQRLVALNETAINARRDAEKANRSKSKLLAAASHDLRQPLHAMGLLIGGIDASQLDKTSVQTLAQLATLTRETEGLFNSILELSKLEAGTFTAIREPVDIGELFERVKLDFSQRAQMAGTVFTVTQPSASLHVLGDAQALYRIIANLVTNAIQYAPQGEIHLSGTTNGKTFTISVSDNGPGLVLDAENKTDAAENEGYGLGLSICFALAAAMKTRLSLVSEEAEGARFLLPLEIVTNMQVHKTKVEPQFHAPSLQGLSIVLLEDDPDVRSVTGDALLRLGCNVTTCMSLKDARTALRNAECPILLVTDLDLGRGQSASGLIEDAGEIADALIGVIVTTATPSNVKTQIPEHENIQILEKPFSVGRLASLIRYMTLNS